MKKLCNFILKNFITKYFFKQFCNLFGIQFSISYILNFQRKFIFGAIFDSEIKRRDI